MGGTETETTLKRNRLALDSLALRPRILRDVADVDTGTSFLGHRIRLPVMLAPIGSLQLIEAGGAVTAAEVAASYQTIYFCSSVTSPGRDEVGAATNAPKVFQLYVRGDEAWIDEQVKLAIDAGFEMFCLTVDTAYYSRRERDLIKRWEPSARRGRGADGHIFQKQLSWDTIKHFKDTHDIPLILKGIGTAEETLPSPANTASNASMFRTTAAASSIMGAARSKSCPKWSIPLPGGPASSSTAVSCAAPM